MTENLSNKRDIVVLGLTFGHAAVGFMFGMIFVMVPWLIIVAPQIMIAHSTNISANDVARPIGGLVIVATIVWHVAHFLKQFGVRAIWYGLLASMVSVIGAVPFFLYSGLVGGRYHRPSLADFIGTLKHPGELIQIGLTIGLVLGALMMVSGIVGTLLARRKGYN